MEKRETEQIKITIKPQGEAVEVMGRILERWKIHMGKVGILALKRALEDVTGRSWEELEAEVPTLEEKYPQVAEILNMMLEEVERYKEWRKRERRIRIA